MEIEAHPIAPARDERRSYVDLGAVIAGALVATGVAVVLAGFSAAMGLGSISFADDGGISMWWLILTAIFAVVSMVAAYWLGGYIAGRMRRPTGDGTEDEIATRDGIHGLVVWGLGMVVGGFMTLGAIAGGGSAIMDTAGTVTETAGSVVGGVAEGAGQLAGGVVSGAGQLAGGAAQAVAPTLEDMMPEGMQSNPIGYIGSALLRPGPQPAAPGSTGNPESEISAILLNLVKTGEISDEDQAYLRRLVAARTGLSEPEVNARVSQAIERAKEVRATAEKKLDNAMAQAEQLKADAEARLQQAVDKAQKAAEQARIATILSAFLLAASALVAAAAAYVGAVRGGTHRDEGRIWAGLSYRRR